MTEMEVERISVAFEIKSKVECKVLARYRSFEVISQMKGYNINRD